MADLEDFFAKRDKKKSKSKKFDNADDLAKVLEQKAKEKKKLETGKSNYLPEGGRQSPGPGLPAGDDDEWLEAEEKAPDFSNLKIQELVLTDEDDEDPNQEGQDGEDAVKEGPWNKKTKSKEEDKEKETKDKEVKDNDQEDKMEEIDSNKDKDKESEQEENKTESAEADAAMPPKQEEPAVKKYVPPGMRNKQQDTSADAQPRGPAYVPAGSAASSGAYVPPSRRGTGAAPGIGLASATPLAPKKKGAPTLADEESFPSLS